MAITVQFCFLDHARRLGALSRQEGSKIPYLLLTQAPSSSVYLLRPLPRVFPPGTLRTPGWRRSLCFKLALSRILWHLHSAVIYPPNGLPVLASVCSLFPFLSSLSLLSLFSSSRLHGFTAEAPFLSLLIFFSLLGRSLRDCRSAFIIFRFSIVPFFPCPR